MGTDYRMKKKTVLIYDRLIYQVEKDICQLWWREEAMNGFRNNVEIESGLQKIKERKDDDGPWRIEWEGAMITITFVPVGLTLMEIMSGRNPAASATLPPRTYEYTSLLPVFT